MKSEKGKIISDIIIFLIIIMIGLSILFYIYRMNNFNGFEKAMADKSKMTEFKRDWQVKCSNSDSYKIKNDEYNDAAFYKQVAVKPHTPYKISCMVKTENVICEKNDKDGGAVIGLLDTTEYSEPITGTNDWQRIEFMFETKEKENVIISFRLGGNQNACTGTVWFSDLKLEEGTPRDDTIWKIGCYIIEELDVEIEGKKYNLKTNDLDIEKVKQDLEKFQNDCYNYSNKRMEVNYEIKEVTTPITTISHSDEHGYFIGYKDVKDEIYKDAQKNEYDHVFVICRMENESGTTSIPIYNNWIGLGGMDIYGIGYSLIRLNKSSNIHNFRLKISNKTVDEVYVHEFLHTLEKNMKDNGYEVPELHNYEEYGYLDDAIDGLNQWYKDYMAGTVLDKTTGKKVGLNDFVYSTQPPNNSNFKYSTEVEFNKEPQNLLEHISTMKYYFIQK